MLIIFILFYSSFSVLAQNSDTNKVKNSDTTKVKIKKHSPQKAAIMSACIPGLGQAYNKKYWKIPIIYAGIAAVSYFAILNSDSLKIYKKAYQLRTDGNPATIDNYVTKYTDDDLLQIKNIYRKNLELSFIIGAGIYALNIIDATVDAHLFKFDINDDLSVKVSPLFYTFRDHSVTGLSFSFSFSK